MTSPTSAAAGGAAGSILGSPDPAGACGAGDEPKPTTVRIGEATKVPSLAKLVLSGYDRPWQRRDLLTPPVNPDFVWDPDFVTAMSVFWLNQSRRALKVIGHTGTGKTEGIMQWHAMLNLPLFMVMANPRTEAQTFIGRMGLTAKGGMAWVDGPLTRAARQGCSVLVDEYNLVDAGEASGLNAAIEGKPFTIPETGETICPRQGFRVFVTQNPQGPGYRGRQLQDVANDSRFINVELHYLTPERERPLVKRLLERFYAQMPNRPDEAWLDKFVESLVLCANAIRAKHIALSDAYDALPCTMCTRTLLAWAEWTAAARLTLPADVNPTHWAFDKVLAGSQQADVREALHQIVTITTGEPGGPSKVPAP